MPLPSSRNLAIQQLRGVAILLVLLQHLSLPSTLLGALPVKLANPGYTGVELFFVISGFVVTQSLRRGRWEIRPFAIRRVFRLYPAILVFVAACFTVLAVVARWPADSFVHAIFGGGAQLFAAQSFGVLTGSFINLGLPVPYVFGAMWSLSVEFQFYAATGVAVVLLRRLGARESRCEHAVLAAAAAILAAALATRILGWDGGGRAVGYVLDFKFEFLAMGVLLGALAQSAAQRLAAALRGRIGIALLVGAALLFIGLHRGPLDPLPPGAELSRFDLLRSGYAGLVLLFGMVVAVAAGIDDATGGTTRSGRAMLWLGDRSYSLYLLHFPVLALMWFGLHAIDFRLVADPWLNQPVQFVVGGLLCCLAAHACYRWVEKPGITLASDLLRGLRGTTPAAPGAPAAPGLRRPAAVTEQRPAVPVA